MNKSYQTLRLDTKHILDIQIMLAVDRESNKKMAFYTVKIQFRNSNLPPFNWTD